MAISAHNITTKLDIVNPLQYIGEGDTEATPANYGVPPTNPTYLIVGNNATITPSIDIAHVDVAGLGSENLLDYTGPISKAYAFSIRFHPINLTLWKYLWQASAAGTVNPRESLSFFYSYYLNGAKYFRYINGARPTSGTLSIARGIWDCEMTFIAKNITTPTTTEQDPGTPVYLTVETSTAPIMHTDGGGSPFTLGAVVYGERRFSISCARSVSIMDVNGETDIIYTKLNDRRVSWSADVFIGKSGSETAIETAFKAKTKLAMSYKFNSVGPITLTTANNVITSYNEVFDAGNTDAVIASVTGTSESVTNL